MIDAAPDMPTAAAPADFVPERIDAPPPPRAKRRRFIGLLLGPPGLWLLPKTVGPHLAQTPLWKGILAFLFSVVGVYALIIIAQANDIETYEDTNFPGGISIPTNQPVAPPDLLTRCRMVIATWMLEAAGSGSRLRLLIEGPGAVLVGVVYILIGTLALLVWMPAGDTLRSIFGRSLRLSCWLTTLTIPIAAIAVFVRPLYIEWQATDESVGNSIGVLILASMVFVIWVALRAGLRYAGPPVGPGFEAVEPRCWSCGYTLQALPIAGRCPECGEPITDSLRRYTEHDPPARGIFRRCGALATDIVRTIVAPTRMFRSLRVRFDTPRARRVWAANMTLITLVVGLYMMAENLIEYGEIALNDWTEFMANFLLIAIGSQVLVGCICLLGARLRAAGRTADARITTIALGYASSTLWLSTIWMLTATFSMEWLDSTRLIRGEFQVASLGRWVTYTEVVWLFIAIVQGGLLLVWGLTIDKAYRNLRYA